MSFRTSIKHEIEQLWKIRARLDELELDPKVDPSTEQELIIVIDELELVIETLQRMVDREEVQSTPTRSAATSNIR
jgi:hypothetical protein